MATDVRDRATIEPSEPSGSRKRRWWEWVLQALPALAFLATFGYFFVDKNEAARSVFRSARGLLTVAAIVVGYLVIAFVLRRYVRWSWVAPLVLTGVVVGLAAWIVRPYYVDETDNTRLVRGPIVDAPDASPGSTPANAPESSPPQPVRLAVGTIQGLAGHHGSGDVSLIRQPDGSFIVRFENFDIEGSPAPVVYLVEGNDVRSPGGTNLGGQRGNQGTVSDYEVPGGTSPGPGWTVLVWCESFAVPIVNASLSAV